MLVPISRKFLACLAVSIALLSPALVHAQAASFQVVSVDALGCNSGDFDMTVLRSNLNGSPYTVRTVVTVGSLIYMNESASISINGTTPWSVFNNFSYGSVPNPGTYPIPSGQQMRLDFTLEQPMGTILYRWTLIVDGCNTGAIIFNGVTPQAATGIPTLQPVGLAILGLSIVALLTWRQRKFRLRRTGTDDTRG